MKVSIYLRTSTKEQNPELQKNDCINFAISKGYEIDCIEEEKLSGFKDIERPKYEMIKEKARRGEIKAVIVWALDRWVRNRDTLIEDVTILRTYGCKIHSVKEAWLEAINIEGSLGKTIQEFLLGLIGSLGEMESQRKSERMIIAYKGYSGSSWGRPELAKEVNEQIIDLFLKGHSLREIREKVFYWDSNRNKKIVSLGYVHKTIKDFKGKNNRLEDVQLKNN